MTADEPEPSPAPQRRVTERLAPFLFFFLVWGLAAAFYARHPLLYDTDSYYHLAVGRLYAEQGIVDDLSWARFSAFAEGFGDKELLFHFLLAPFAALPDPVQGGRLALAFLDALLLTALGLLARRALGRAPPGLRGGFMRWGWMLVPFFLVVSVSELSWRLVRLRPDLLSLLLLLLALDAAARRRYRLTGFLALVYTLSYTAFHAFLGLFGALFAFFYWARRRPEPGLLLYPLLGAGLGLLLHPGFPENLEVWSLQSLAFFSLKDTLDVGSEIGPNFTSVVLLMPLGWFLALAALWRSGVPREDGEDREDARRAADAFGVAAFLFGGLYLLMSRFSIYVFPLATLAVLFALRAGGRAPGKWVALPFRGRIPLAAALSLALLVSLPEARRQLGVFASRTDPGPGGIRTADREALARALPAGARVAAPWASTHLYVFHAPQAVYLNVLDPVFMAVRFPRAYAVQRRLFAGDLADVPRDLAVELDSDHLAFSTLGEGRKLLARVADDPRLVALHTGFNAVYRLVPNANRAFVRDWRLAPSQEDALAPAAALATWPPYPLLPPGQGGDVEGYVDVRRIDPEGAGCRTFVRAENVEQTTALDLELSPSGPSTLWLDGRPVISLRAGNGAVLGRGTRVPLTLAPGEHRLAVTTCPEEGPPGSRAGFYLLERGRQSNGDEGLE